MKTHLLCVHWYCEDGVSGRITEKDVTNKANLHPGIRGPGVRRHTVSSDVNTSAVRYHLHVLYSSLYLCPLNTVF